MYIDAHNHLCHYQGLIQEALKQIQEKSILTIDCAINEETYLCSKELAKEQPLVVPCFGIHPMEAHRYHDRLEDFEGYIVESPMIGEIGLDYHWVKDRETYPLQRKVLRYFFQRARQYDKVVNLHTKGAEEEIFLWVKEYRLRSPIIHWYSGPMDIFHRLLDYGCYFTIGVDVGFSDTTKEVLSHLPLDRLLTETDGPTALEWINGEYGYPEFIRGIVEHISQIKRVDPEELKERILENYRNLMGNF